MNESNKETVEKRKGCRKKETNKQTNKCTGIGK